MAINDVLPPKAARRDAIANLKCFGAADTRDLISMVTFTFTMRCHLIRLASAPCISSRLATFGWVRFPCAKRGKYNAEFKERKKERIPGKTKHIMSGGLIISKLFYLRLRV